MPRFIPPDGAPCWFELSSKNADASLVYHEALFGWSHVHNDMGEMGNYTFLRNDNGTVGALCGMPPGSEGRPSAWGVYFAVSDMDAKLAQARTLGAQVYAEFEVPGHGRGAALGHPAGAMFSLWQAAQPEAGDFTMFDQHAIGWVELATRDSAAARAFFSALLGWTFFESKSGAPTEYTEFAVGDTRYGGLMAMNEQWGDMPPHWSLYVPVDDVDACLARATELGGKVCVPAFDVPNVGRIARVDDPAGAGLYVIKLLPQHASG